MSRFAHRGYEHRTGGYGRRRHKAVGFKRERRGGDVVKAAAAFAAVASAAVLLYLFADNLYPFVDSIRSGKKQTADVPVSAALSATADTPAESQKIPLAEGEFDKVDKAVFVSDGAGYLRFKGIDATAKNYAAVLNSISSSMSDKIKLYSMVIPTNTDIGLSGSLDGSNSQRDNLNVISSMVSDRVENIDVYAALSEHRGEYLYYRTDELMTSTGAYYAYLAAAQKAGFDRTYALDTLSEKKGSISPFEGSFIERTKDSKKQPNGNPELHENPDTIEYFKLPVHYDCYSIDPSTGSRKEYDLFSEKAAAADPLAVFPGRDMPLLMIYNLQSSNTAKLLIVKDHSAEPVIGYLIPHYGEIYVADASLYSGNLRELANEYSVTHVMFINSIDDANNSLYCQRLRDLFDNSISNQ